MLEGGLGLNSHPMNTLEHYKEAVQWRWLLPEEVLDLMTNHASLGCVISTAPPECPPSGSVFMYDRRTCKRFRRDGHNWVTRKSAGRIREDHVKLRVGGELRVAAAHAHSADSGAFHRRTYHILPANEGASSEDGSEEGASWLSLVHYRACEAKEDGSRKIRRDQGRAAALAAEQVERALATVDLGQHLDAASPDDDALLVDAVTELLQDVDDDPHSPMGNNNGAKIARTADGAVDALTGAPVEICRLGPPRADTSGSVPKANTGSAKNKRQVVDKNARAGSAVLAESTAGGFNAAAAPHSGVHHLLEHGRVDESPAIGFQQHHPQQQPPQKSVAWDERSCSTSPGANFASSPDRGPPRPSASTGVSPRPVPSAVPGRTSKQSTHTTGVLSGSGSSSSRASFSEPARLAIADVCPSHIFCESHEYPSLGEEHATLLVALDGPLRTLAHEYGPGDRFGIRFVFADQGPVDVEATAVNACCLRCRAPKRAFPAQAFVQLVLLKAAGTDKVDHPTHADDRKPSVLPLSPPAVEPVLRWVPVPSFHPSPAQVSFGGPRGAHSRRSSATTISTDDGHRSRRSSLWVPENDGYHSRRTSVMTDDGHHEAGCAHEPDSRGWTAPSSAPCFPISEGQVDFGLFEGHHQPNPLSSRSDGVATTLTSRSSGGSSVRTASTAGTKRATAPESLFSPRGGVFGVEHDPSRPASADATAGSSIVLRETTPQSSSSSHQGAVSRRRDDGSPRRDERKVRVVERPLPDGLNGPSSNLTPRSTLPSPSGAEGDEVLNDERLASAPDAELDAAVERLVLRVVGQMSKVAATDAELADELDAPDAHGLCLLHYCALYNLSSVIAQLVALGAHPDGESGSSGLTPLHLAAGAGHVGVVAELLRAGADVDKPDHNGMTSRDRAMQAGHHKVAAMIDESPRALLRSDRKRVRRHFFDESSADDSVRRARDTDDDVVRSSVESDGLADGEAGRLNKALLHTAFASLSLHEKCALSMAEPPSPRHDPGTQRPNAGTSSPVHNGGTSPDMVRNLPGGRRQDAPFGDGEPLHNDDASRPDGESSNGADHHHHHHRSPGGASVVGRDDPTVDPTLSSSSRVGSLSRDAGSARPAMSSDNSRRRRGDPDVGSVLSKDKKSLGVAMSLMGAAELTELQDEARVITANVRSWIVRRNYKKVRDAARTLESKWIQRRSQRNLSAVHEAEHARTSSPSQGEHFVKLQGRARGMLERKKLSHIKDQMLALLVISRNFRPKIGIRRLNSSTSNSSGLGPNLSIDDSSGHGLNAMSDS